LPRAYEKSLIEVARRRKFRRLLDEDVSRLKKAITHERDSRNVFMSEYGRLLPSEFIPQLRELVSTIRIEGGTKDYELPEVNEELAGNTGFDHLTGGSSEGADPHLQKKYSDLIKESTLLKEEHKSNMKDLNTKIEDLELQVRLKVDKNADVLK